MDEVAHLIGDMAVREERMAAVAQEARILLNRLQPSAGSSSDSQQRE